MTSFIARQPLVLCILDGWGINPSPVNNGIHLANTPNWDNLLNTSPWAQLQASEEHVGLPEGQMGNSEVGHMTIGAGRVIMQDLPAINKMMREGTLEQSTAFHYMVDSLKSNGGTCHVMGLLSDGGVHSHIDHLLYIVQKLASQKIKVCIHAFFDGRDTPPKSALHYLEKLNTTLRNHSYAVLASIGGRYYGMDRDQRWERIEKAYNVITQGDNGTNPMFSNAVQAVADSYAEGIVDEFIIPQAREGYKGINDNDCIMMVNFRSDRVRQLLRALLQPGFKEFKRHHIPKISSAVGMVDYSSDLANLMEPIIQKTDLKNNLGAVIANHGGRQLRISETEKYAHVTFFFNGGIEEPFPGEERILINSPKVATYDLQPEMSAFELMEKLNEELDRKVHDLIVVNFANTDMVGHTGVQPAIIKAIESVDQCLGKVVERVKANGYQMIVTADHGNAEMMVDPESQQPHTAHTCLPVPFVLFNHLDPQGVNAINIQPGHLGNIAPTALKLMGIAQPKEMTEFSLI